MLVFFDTEFTDLGIDPRLISIGLVSEDGERSFYAELSETYQLSDVGDFARLAVLPLLEGGSALMTMPELALRLGNWLESFEQPITLATDSLAWDWPWIQEIFSAPYTWPDNLDGKPLLLTMNYLHDYDRFIDAVENAFSSLRRHHSLDDAKANRIGWIAAGGDTEQGAGRQMQRNEEAGAAECRRQSLIVAQADMADTDLQHVMDAAPADVEGWTE